MPAWLKRATLRDLSADVGADALVPSLPVGRSRFLRPLILIGVSSMLKAQHRQVLFRLEPCPQELREPKLLKLSVFRAQSLQAE